MGREKEGRKEGPSLSSPERERQERPSMGPAPLAAWQRFPLDVWPEGPWGTALITRAGGHRTVGRGCTECSKTKGK